MSHQPKLFLGSEFDQGKEDFSLFHILPVPYEESVSYGGGTSRGPAAILDASDQLEAYDGTGFPGEEGFYTHAPVDCQGGQPLVFPRITEAVQRILSYPHPGLKYGGKKHTPETPLQSIFRKIPIVLGGEHSITFPVIQAFANVFGAQNIGVVQFDAHADLHEAYDGNPYSHASVMYRINQDLNIPIYQLGIRALGPDEIFYRTTHGIPGIDGPELGMNNITECRLPEDFPPLVFITFDVDGLDPAIMPSTGTPVPGGIGWYQALGLLNSVAKQRRIIGFDVVELAPIANLHAPDYLAAELTHKLMGIIARSTLSNPDWSTP